MNDTILVSDATKVIKNRVVLDAVSVSLDRGGIYGFLGVNGSGKTMLFRAISGLIHLTSGFIEVFGKRIGADVDFAPGLGLCLEPIGFWDDLTGFDNLMALASIRHLVGEEEVRGSLQRVGLDPADTRPFGSYSLGMRQRLNIAQAIMEKPELLVLDEPTNSLDVEGMGRVRSIILEEREGGCTVLVACHNEPDLEALFDRTFLMESGRLREAI